MPKKVCGFGFECGSTLLQPGLEPGECPNYVTCGRATRLTLDEEIELIRVRQVQQEETERRSHQAQQEQARRQEVWSTTRRQIALERLMQRGCPQTVEQYIPNDTFEQLNQAIAQLQAQLTEFEGTYIPLEGTNTLCVGQRQRASLLGTSSAWQLSPQQADGSECDVCSGSRGTVGADDSLESG
jgi:hypothetical protein